jgi:hypothetical protein
MDTVRREVRVRDFGFGAAHGWASCMAVRAAGGVWAEAHAPVPDTRVLANHVYSLFKADLHRYGRPRRISTRPLEPFGRVASCPCRMHRCRYVRPARTQRMRVGIRPS